MDNHNQTIIETPNHNDFNDESCFDMKNIQECKSLSENYLLDLSQVKKGGFGQVIVATDKITGQKRAVKMIKKHEDQSNVSATLKEIEIMRMLDHPNLINVIEYFDDDHFFYIIMEYVNDGELFDRIIANEYFSEKKVAQIMKQLISAVYYLHMHKIVHRDIKPENILFDGEIIKLVDFGASSIMQYRQKKHKFAGTSYYIAPEVIKGNYDEMCDIWSCGVIMYILITGRPPFDGGSINSILTSVIKGTVKFDKPEFKKVSLETKDLIKQMLTYEPYKRSKADEVLNHPWFKIIHNHNDTIDKTFLKKLKKFDRKYKIQEGFYRFMVKKILCTKQKNQIIESFQALDSNNDGILSKTEVIEGFRKVYNNLSYLEICAIVDKMTPDDNIGMNFTDFIAKVIDKDLLLSEDNIKKGFMIIDVNNDNAVSISELKNALSSESFTESEIDEFLNTNRYTHMKKTLTLDEFKKFLLHK